MQFWGLGFLFDIISTDEEPPAVATVPDGPVTGTVGIGGFGEQIPNTPKNLTITDIGYNTMDLAWDNVFFEQGYRLYRKVGTGGSYALRADLDAPNLTTHTDGGLSQGTYVCYQVTAYNVSGESGKSNEVCETTATCTNTAGPEVTINNPNITEQFPSVSWINLAGDRHFAKNSRVRFNYTIAAGDQCNNSFAVKIEVFLHGETTPIDTINETKGVGTHRPFYTLPQEPAPDEPGGISVVGFYDVKITASDEIPSHTAVVSTENYFKIKPLPDPETEAPQLVSLTASKDLVCPRESYKVEAEFSDNSLSLLGDYWLRTSLYEDGTQRWRWYWKEIYKIFETGQNLTSNISKVYTVDALDLYLNLAEPTDSVTVTIRPDAQAPTFEGLPSFPTPAGNELQAGISYNVSATALDDCPTDNLQYQLLFRDGSTDYVLRDFTFFESFSFIPNGQAPAVNTTGHLVLVVRDVADHTAESTSTTEYTITPSENPQLTITTVPADSLSIGQEINIQLTAVDDDLTGATLEFLKYRHWSIGIEFAEEIPAPSSFTNGMQVPWTIPAFPWGAYILTAQIKDNQDNIANASKTIMVYADDVSYQVIFMDMDMSGAMPFDQMVQFDIDADGEDEWTTWLNPSDGFLIIDRNGNGAVDNINDFTFRQELMDAAGDVIDSSDALYSTVKIWVDADSNASSSASELTTLQSNGITKITLEPCCSFEME